jgi:6-phosphogluconate dehydrogenase
MQIGMIGLGKMGANMTSRLIAGGHEVVVHDRDTAAVATAAKSGAASATSLQDVVKQLRAPRAIWVMVPSGAPTEGVVGDLAGLVAAGDVILDGGNSNYKDTVRRGKELQARKIDFVDVGTSGGVWGLKEGYSMMIGGATASVERLRPIFETLAPAADLGWGHVGPIGSGHFVKMIHNGIEYGMMQAYAEGFEILRAKKEFDLDLHGIAEIWRHGSVVRSWLLDLTANALRDDPELPGIRGWVSDSGEGRWTVAEAIDLDVPAPAITLALLARLTSRNPNAYQAKLLSALRNQFGGHAIKKSDD